MQVNPNEKWLILWETNRGCPFQCTFCDWGSAIAAKVSQFDLERLLKEVDWFADKKIEFIFTCDANYGMLARDYDITKYVADTKQRLGYPKALSVQNTRMARSARTRSRNYCPTPVSTRVLRSLCNRWTQRRSKQSSARIFRPSPTKSCSGPSPATGWRPIPI